jgi:hypothetical protein
MKMMIVVVDNIIVEDIEDVENVENMLSLKDD